MLVWRRDDVNHTTSQRYPTNHGTSHSYPTESKLDSTRTDSDKQERPHARLRDYLTIAPTLGVSHMLAFSLTDAANVHMRVARLPQGPTLTFRVQRYSLVR
jgi:hypothetical protein